MEPHTSKGYDELLERAHALAGEMCVRVERQLVDAIESLSSGEPALVDQILRHEAVVNSLERSIDAAAGQIIARRQPTGSDLRLLLALLNVTTDLERVGDEAKKIALQARHIYAGRALDELDARAAAELARRDAAADAMFRGLTRQLVSYMIEDPRTISACLDILLAAKSLERVGDHAMNVSEHVMYACTGRDVRHASVQEKSVIP